MFRGFILVEPLLFWVGIGLSGAFCVLLIIFVLFLVKMPKSAKAICSCWLKKKILVIDANEVGQFLFKPFKRNSHEGQLERDIGGGWKEVRLVPRHHNPIVATPYVLEGTGIPCHLSYSPKAITFTPKMLAAMTVQNTDLDKREQLSEGLKQWAKKAKMPVETIEEVITKLNDKEGNELKDDAGNNLIKIDHVKKIVEKPISTMNFEDSESFYGRTWSTTDYQIQIRKAYLAGLEKGRQMIGLGGKLLLPIIIIVCVVIAFIVLFGGGGLS